MPQLLPRLPEKSSGLFLKLAYVAAFIAFTFTFTCSLQAQSDCDNIRYRYTTAFENYSVDYDIPYGENINSDLNNETLVFDLYQPVDDTESQRPLIVIAHGGFFIAGSNNGLDVVPLCEDFARMGYVVASISYRMGIDNLFSLEQSFAEAVYRGIHDSKAAVRFFRKSAEEDGNPYGIDAEKIILGGVSAGGFIALHHAFVDLASEVPEIINTDEPGLGGGMEGESGNPGFSSDVLGIFNISGALFSTDAIETGALKPVVSVHGTNDLTVPYGTGDVGLLGFTIYEVDGSGPVHETLDSLEAPNCLITIEGAGHVPHVLGGADYDLTLSSIAGFISALLCPSYESTCGGYDYTDPGTIGIAPEPEAGAALALFPNPVSRTHTFRIKGIANEQSWVIYDLMGREMLRGQGASAAISAAGWSSGFYQLKTTKNGKSFPFLIVD